jgi:outer membrane scaffolding protein for murein synthesis (MipA/OmpV family)
MRVADVAGVGRRVCLLAFAVLVLVATAAPARAQSFTRSVSDLLGVIEARLDQLDPNRTQLRLGAGGVLASRLDDSPNVRAYPLPFVAFQYRDIVAVDETQLRINLIGAGTDLGKQGFRAGPMARVDPGRGNVSNPGLPGLGKVPLSLEVGGFVAYSLGPARVRVRLRQDVTGGHGGTVGEVDLRTGLWRRDALGVGLQVQAVWGSRKYVNAFYGVSARQAAATGLSMFDARAGFKDVNIGLFGEYKFSERWSALAAAQYVRLVGDAAASPIAERRGLTDRVNFGLFFIYTFGKSKPAKG